MEWFLPCYWAAALSASASQTTLWGWPGLSPAEPAAHNKCAEPTALDLELIRVVYGVLVERADCGVCGAPLNSAVDVELTRRSITGGRIVVATCCRGSRQHRHVARVVERNGDLRFGRLEPRNWLILPAIERR